MNTVDANFMAEVHIAIKNEVLEVSYIIIADNNYINTTDFIFDTPKIRT